MTVIDKNHFLTLWGLYFNIVLISRLKIRIPHEKTLPYEGVELSAALKNDAVSLKNMAIKMHQKTVRKLF